MLKAFKYRIYPTDEQRQKIDATISVCRLVYNLGLEIKARAWKEHCKTITSFDLCYQLVELKREYCWINAIDSQALQASVKKIDIAFKNFFNGYGYPKFKKKNNAGSFQCPNNTRKVDFKNKLLTIPKIANIPIVVSRTFEGNIKTVTISRTATGKYYASILVDTNITTKDKQPIYERNTIGIDVGIKNLVISSDGRKFEPNRKLKENLQRLKALSRRVSRKKKGSVNRKKAVLRLASLHERISFQRLDYIHKVTHALTHDNQVDSIVIEDLNVAGLLKNSKISQAMSDVSLGQFFTILKYKCEWYGINLLQIGRFDPSSKRCSCCGEINSDLELSDREWTCSYCSTHHDRDFNAALNIKWYGLRKTIFNNKSPMGSRVEPAEMSALVESMKQEGVLYN